MLCFEWITKKFVFEYTVKNDEICENNGMPPLPLTRILEKNIYFLSLKYTYVRFYKTSLVNFIFNGACFFCDALKFCIYAPVMILCNAFTVIWFSPTLIYFGIGNTLSSLDNWLSSTK